MEHCVCSYGHQHYTVTLYQLFSKWGSRPSKAILTLTLFKTFLLEHDFSRVPAIFSFSHTTSCFLIANTFATFYYFSCSIFRVIFPINPQSSSDKSIFLQQIFYAVERWYNSYPWKGKVQFLFCVRLVSVQLFECDFCHLYIYELYCILTRILWPLNWEVWTTHVSSTWLSHRIPHVKFSFKIISLV